MSITVMVKTTALEVDLQSGPPHILGLVSVHAAAYVSFATSDVLLLSE